jgi:hypothetical protein
MGLDMLGLIDITMESLPAGGVFHIPGQAGAYTGAGGTWEQPDADPVELKLVNIQQASPKEVQQLTGGVNEPVDMKVLHINDGTMLYPDDEGRYSDVFRFSDGLAMRDWKVVQADCRPWRSYCRVVVERLQQ